ncbi:MAG TPA: PH domain-containing protein [Dehalococcoidia bacterium]|nr:PH domain-containing protein [Dehalococcoidia bacterium]
MPSFTVFKPISAPGTLFGAGIALVSLAVGALLLYQGLTMEPQLGQMAPLFAGGFLLCLAALYGYWTWSCSSLQYVVDRNALSIRWGSLRQVVPLPNIERLLPGEETDNLQIDGVNWPGHHVGRAAVESIGEVLFYSTHRSPKDVLYVQTPSETYGISVPDPVFFAQTIQSNQARGVLEEQRQAVRRRGVGAQSFWLDPAARGLALVLVAAFAVVLGYVLDMYPGLDRTLALRFPASGGIEQISDKSVLLDIPRSAFAIAVLDFVLAVLLHSWERMVGYALLVAGIGMQVMLLVAAAVAVA